MVAHKRLVDVTCLVRVSDETPMAAIRQAIALAAGAGARLTVVIGVQMFVAPYSPFWSGMAASIAADVNAEARKRGESLGESVRREAGAAGVDADVRLVAGTFSEITDAATHAARMSDLVVVDQQHGAFDTNEMLLEDALFRSGRPVLVASPQQPAIADIRRILVAWDGSHHVVRAVADALAVFEGIEAVEVVTVSGEKELAGILPGADYAHHLARKGLAVTLTDIAAEGRPVAGVLDAQAAQSKADLIIAGAFGHSRLREFLLGGVTVDLTGKARASVLMAG